MTDSISPVTRRTLLKNISALALTPATLPLGVSLMGMANAAAQTATDYKALVCVFLNGGNDNFNTVVPYDTTSYNSYFGFRKNVEEGTYNGLAILRSALEATALASTVGLPSGRQMALNPTMGGLKTVFDAGRAAVLMNVGLLLRPTTKVDYLNHRSLPNHLFSHTISEKWLTSDSYGWGGRAADLFLARNATAALTTITVGGNARFVTGSDVNGYRVGPRGPSSVAALTSGMLFDSPQCAQALQTLIRQSSTRHVMEDDYAVTMRSALDVRQTLENAIGTSVPSKFATWFPAASGTNLSAQLQVVARMIEQGPALGQKRQVFIVGMGGFDTHDNLVENHPGLVGAVSTALAAFDTALLGLNMANSVTTFTASDFGRQLVANGDGSDHGWGGDQFIMGGAVKGNRFMGQPPIVGIGHNLDLGAGRMLPTTAIDQMSVELANWFGVSATDIRTIFPNSQYFNLGGLGVFK
jgi:uncharacterized protein (DUF1501 family)